MLVMFGLLCYNDCASYRTEEDRRRWIKCILADLSSDRDHYRKYGIYSLSKADAGAAPAT